MNHIHPIFDKILNREKKESLLKQKAKVIWMVGLSGSGKSTLANALENMLHERGHLTQLLDGDNLRVGVNNNLGFTEQDREENIRRSAEVAKLFLDCGVITVCSLISPLKAYREMARTIIGPENFIEVYVNTPFEVCEERDVKGLYKKARKGEIKNFTGLDAPFEAPESPDLMIPTAQLSLEASGQLLFDTIYQHVRAV